jgi:23S rRNA pseudouridine955/2504/2580 synthase
VHAQYAGCPLMGDDKYGVKEEKAFEQTIGLNRLFLHAYQVTFKPAHDEPAMTITADLPKELQQVLAKLKSE